MARGLKGVLFVLNTKGNKMSGKQLNVKMGLRKERKGDWFNSSKEKGFGIIILDN